MSSSVLGSLFFLSNDRGRGVRSRISRRHRFGLELLEARITPTSVTGLSPTSGPTIGGTSVTDHRDRLHRRHGG